MEEGPLDFRKLRKGAQTPTRDKDSVGYDIKAPASYIIPSKTTGVICTGLAFAIPKGYYGRLAAKSQQAWQYSLVVLGGVIDPGYTREVFALIHVLGEKDFEIEKGKEFIQLILEGNTTPPLKEVKQLSPPTKTVKQYSVHTQKAVKRLTQTQPAGETVQSLHRHRYHLRERKTRKQTGADTCRYCH